MEKVICFVLVVGILETCAIGLIAESNLLGKRRKLRKVCRIVAVIAIGIIATIVTCNFAG